MMNLNFLIVSLFLAQVANCQTFYAANKKLYDANGKEFLIRGINNNHGWDNLHNGAYDALPYIAATGANTVRVVQELASKLPHLEEIIKRLISLKMIGIIELHDATGSTDLNKLLACANWFKNNIELFKKYQKYVLINIANEWSPWGTKLEVWRDAYKQAISVVRSSGWRGALVIDASAYAQNPDGPITYGKELVTHDPLHNLVFSIHMYGEWKKVNPNYKISEKLWQLWQAGLTVIVGEFTLKLEEGCGWTDFDAVNLMRECAEKGYGYLGWSWHGNGNGACNKPLTPLNMVKGDAQQKATWTTQDFTEFGNVIVNTPGYGIKASSKKASVFN